MEFEILLDPTESSKREEEWTHQFCLKVNLVDFQKCFVVNFKYCDTEEPEVLCSNKENDKDLLSVVLKLIL